MAKLNFLERINKGDILISDGATGTNLQARGLPIGKSPENWLFEEPEKCMELQREFIKAGADIILTDTFGGTPIKLGKIGLAEKVADVNKLAVDLARQAIADSDVLLAGSIGPTGELLKPLGTLDESDAINEFSAQAKSLSEAGVDLIVIETQFDIAEAIAAIKGVKMVCTLPIVCSFSYDRGKSTMMGVNPQKMAEAINPLGVDILGVNCGRSLEDNLNALKELKKWTNLPIWFKPNAGMPRLDGGKSIYDVTPEDMGAQVESWIAAGARIVGGCCGTSPAHLRAIAQAVKKGHIQKGN